MDNNFFGSVPRDHGKPSVTIFWFRENSCTETCCKTYFKVKEHQCVLLFTKYFIVY